MIPRTQEIPRLPLSLIAFEKACDFTVIALWNEFDFDAINLSSLSK